jgi:GNAT superfamily N-acetyltransferase
MDVRPATPDDLDAIVALHTGARTAYYRAGGLDDAEIDDPAQYANRVEGWTRAVRGEDRTVLCAVDGGGTVIGVLGMGPPSGTELYQIHVAPGHWRQGVGSALHAAYVAALRAAGLPFGTVSVWERNTRGRAFYAHHGWRPDGHREPGPGGADYLKLRLTVGARAA